MGLSEEQLLEQFAATRKASTQLAMASPERKQLVLHVLASLLEENAAQILAENQLDLNAIALENPMRDRLLLSTAERMRFL